jgi:hypothetical protein
MPGPFITDGLPELPQLIEEFITGIDGSFDDFVDLEETETIVLMTALFRRSSQAERVGVTHEVSVAADGDSVVVANATATVGAGGSSGGITSIVADIKAALAASGAIDSSDSTVVADIIAALAVAGTIDGASSTVVADIIAALAVAGVIDGASSTVVADIIAALAVSVNADESASVVVADMVAALAVSVDADESASVVVADIEVAATSGDSDGASTVSGSATTRRNTALSVTISNKTSITAFGSSPITFVDDSLTSGSIAFRISTIELVRGGCICYNTTTVSYPTKADSQISWELLEAPPIDLMAPESTAPGGLITLTGEYYTDLKQVQLINSENSDRQNADFTIVDDNTLQVTAPAGITVGDYQLKLRHQTRGASIGDTNVTITP